MHAAFSLVLSKHNSSQTSVDIEMTKEAMCQGVSTHVCKLTLILNSSVDTGTQRKFKTINQMCVQLYVCLNMCGYMCVQVCGKRSEDDVQCLSQALVLFTKSGLLI